MTNSEMTIIIKNNYDLNDLEIQKIINIMRSSYDFETENDVIDLTDDILCLINIDLSQPKEESLTDLDLIRIINNNFNLSEVEVNKVISIMKAEYDYQSESAVIELTDDILCLPKFKEQ